MRDSFDPRQIRSRLLASEQFVAGRHGIARVDSDFAERFHSLSFVPATASEVVEMSLLRNMSNEEILRELRPRTATLSDLFVHLHRSAGWPWEIWFLGDANGLVAAVTCVSMDGEWHIDAGGPSEPWPTTYRVYGRARTPLVDLFLNGGSRLVRILAGNLHNST